MMMEISSVNKQLMIMKTTKNDDFFNSLMEDISLRDVQNVEIRMEVASAIYNAMSDSKIDSCKLADILNVSLDDVLLWLSGTIDIPVEKLCSIERAIGKELSLPASMYAY